MVILASLVQREINNVQDASCVASVYWNRIYKPANGTVGLLQSDPSVEYARDSETHPAKYWAPLNDIGDNIATNSPWNTYLNKGWPPTPICSPGLAALTAAAAPADNQLLLLLRQTKRRAYRIRQHTGTIPAG